MKQWITGAARAAWRALTSKKARRLEAALIAYVVAELTKAGYLPGF